MWSGVRRGPRARRHRFFSAARLLYSEFLMLATSGSSYASERCLARRALGGARRRMQPYMVKRFFELFTMLNASSGVVCRSASTARAQAVLISNFVRGSVRNALCNASSSVAVGPSRCATAASARAAPIARTALREQQKGRQSAPHAALRTRTSNVPAPPRALRRASGRRSSFSRVAILRRPVPALESLKNSIALRIVVDEGGGRRGVSVE